MSSFGLSPRASAFIWAATAILCLLGTGCLPNLPGPSDQIAGDGSVSVELVNETFFIVDPRLILGGQLQHTGPVGPAGSRTVGIGCSSSDVLSLDPILLVNAGNVQVSINSPELVEGVDYACGDAITFTFRQRVDGAFFVDVQRKLSSLQ